MYTKAKQEAEKIFQDFAITIAPIDVKSIAEKMGIEISYAPSAKYSGMLIRKSDKKSLMGINNNESTGRMRFTIAHELGHYILHPRDSVNIDYRDKHHSIQKSQKEKLADFFAANLLMPESLIKNDFNFATKKGIFFEDDLINLADKYQVSGEAMKWRLVNLNLIPVE
ncbi:MAG: ImmA/IrrE family metallo-endopeptidase [Candidatus Magasanikbacteria bacterium]|nr:ImmA/IrrE family metallo-endopeptidase [Candidatus Magasanikbacteria bacterium]